MKATVLEASNSEELEKKLKAFFEWSMKILQVTQSESVTTGQWRNVTLTIFHG
jgi:hypothetical protein